MKVLFGLLMIAALAKPAHAEPEVVRTQQPCTEVAQRACWGTGWEGSWYEDMDTGLCYCDKFVKPPKAVEALVSVQE